MLVDVFNSYFPENNIPLLVSFANHLRFNGYSIEVDFDLWDMLAFRDLEEPEIAILSLNRPIKSSQLRTWIDFQGPTKIILAEAGACSLSDAATVKLFLARANAAVYFRDIGWILMPGIEPSSKFQDWALRSNPRYREEEPGVWSKQCTDCKGWKTVDMYYKRPRAHGTAKDPRRNLCKTCWTRRYKKGLRNGPARGGLTAP